MISAQQPEGEFARELGETGAGSHPAVKEQRGPDRGPSLDRQENLSQARSALTAEQQIPAADPAGYSTMYLRFLTMKLAFPKLNHTGHEPKPANFGLSEQQAAFIRVQIDREFKRKV